MKMPIIIGTLMLGGSVVAFKGVDLVDASFNAAETRTAESITLQAGGAGEHCVAYVKPIWASVKRMEPDLGTVKGTAARGLLHYAAKSFCACVEERFGANRSPREKSMMGNLAGLHMAMALGHRRDKRMQDWTKERARKVVGRSLKAARTTPRWMREMNMTFHQCQSDINLRKKLPSWLKL